MTRAHRLRTGIAVLAVLLIAIMPAGGQDKSGPVCQAYKDQNGIFEPSACNGISVGAPKVFDNRTLTLMLEALSQTLRAQQQGYLDQKSVLAALANLQGFSQTETSTNLSVTGTPTPASDVKTTLNTGLVNASGNPLPNTFQRQTDLSRASVTPQAPALDTLPALQGFNPTYGSSAADLLNDQVNLSYQIFNLRMVLERSLSDRLLPGATGDKQTRLQAVLGFNVTIDPPRTANDAVAVVEITLTSNDNKDLSLVSLMPQEKTYNAAALSNKSNAFGGAAAVSVFQVGFSARKRSQIFYLFRDTDTLSYERMTGDPTKIVFGWMFRPVLGRRSVSPGLRQMFAIMALPRVDCDTKHEGCTASLNSKVRTYWKKYDHTTLTSFEHRNANRASLFWYELSLGLAKPQIFDEYKYENDATFPGTEVLSSTDYQEALKPKVSQVTWRPTGAKSIVISARGNNFFSETQVALGDKTYSEGSGLILKSNQAFDLITTLDALVNGPGTVLGRYDIGVPLTNTDVPDSLPKDGVEVQEASLQPSLAGIRKIEIHLQKKASSQQLAELKSLEEAEQSARGQLKSAADVRGARAKLQEASKAVESKNREVYTLRVQDLPLDGITKSLNAPETPVISLNGTTLDLPYQISNTAGEGIPRIVIQANVKDSLVSESGGGIVKVSWPFYPQDKWTATYQFYNPDLAFQVTRVSPKSILINRVDGFSFKKAPETVTNEGKSTCWNLIASDEELPLIPGCPLKPTPGSNSSPPEPSKKGKAETHAAPLCAPAENADATTKPDASMLPYMYLCAPSDDFIAATVDDLPDKVVLVAPNGSTYTLTVPEFKAKEEKVQPIELKQYDSQWIEIKPKDLTTSATPPTGDKDAGPDLGKVASVEANAKPLNYVPQKDKAPSTDDKTKETAPSVKSIKVEITRELTAKPGTVDIAFHDASGQLLGTRQVHITQTEWGDKGDK